MQNPTRDFTNIDSRNPQNNISNNPNRKNLSSIPISRIEDQSKSKISAESLCNKLLSKKNKISVDVEEYQFAHVLAVVEKMKEKFYNKSFEPNKNINLSLSIYEMKILVDLSDQMKCRFFPTKFKNLCQVKNSDSRFQPNCKKDNIIVIGDYDSNGKYRIFKSNAEIKTKKKNSEVMKIINETPNESNDQKEKKKKKKEKKEKKKGKKKTKKYIPLKERSKMKIFIEEGFNTIRTDTNRTPRDCAQFPEEKIKIQPLNKEFENEKSCESTKVKLTESQKSDNSNSSNKTQKSKYENNSTESVSDNKNDSPNKNFSTSFTKLSFENLKNSNIENSENVVEQAKDSDSNISSGIFRFIFLFIKD